MVVLNDVVAVVVYVFVTYLVIDDIDEDKAIAIVVMSVVESLLEISVFEDDAEGVCNDDTIFAEVDTDDTALAMLVDVSKEYWIEEDVLMFGELSFSVIDFEIPVKVEVGICPGFVEMVDEITLLEYVIDDVIPVVDIVVDNGKEKYTDCVTLNSVSMRCSIFTISLDIFVIILVR